MNYNKYNVELTTQYLPERNKGEDCIAYSIRCIEAGFTTSSNGLKPSITYGKRHNNIKNVVDNLGCCDFLQISSGNKIYLYHTLSDEFYYIWITHELKYGWNILDKYSVEILKKDSNI